MDSEFKIEGLDEVIKKMAAAKEQLTGRELGKAVKAGGEIIKDKAIQNAKRIDNPGTKDNISENIVLKVRRNNKIQTITAKIGIIGGAKKPGDEGAPGGDTYYWRFIEFGTSKMPARPFMRKALSENINQATDAVVNSLKISVDKLA